MTIHALLRARKLLVLGILAALVVPLAALGGTSARMFAGDSVTQKEADLYEIDQIEAKFHKATSKQDLNLMMSLFAPGAVFNVDQQTLIGKAQIRHWFATENKAFMPKNHWESDTPTYKLHATVNGDKGTLYFECHYIDPKTKMVVNYVAVQHQVQKINGTWLITNSSATPAVLKP